MSTLPIAKLNQSTPLMISSPFGWTFVCLVVFSFALIYTSVEIALISVVVILCSAGLVSKSVDMFNYRRVTILSFWYLTYLVMLLIPAFVVFSDHEGPFRGRFLFSIEATLITVPLGALLVGGMANFRKEETDTYFRRPIFVPPYSRQHFNWQLALLLISAVLTLLYFRDLGTVPLLYMIQNPGEHLALGLLREEAFKLLDSPLVYFYYLARGSLYPFVITVSLGYWLHTKEKKWFWVLLLSGIGGLAIASASIAKKPVAALFVIVAMFWYFRRNGSLSRRMIACMLILVCLFPFAVVMISYASPNIGALDVADAIADRMFYIPAEVVYYYFEVFPEDTGYLYGRSIDKFARLFGLQYFDTANYVGLYGYSQFHLDTINANGAFIADCNANGGIPAVLIGGVLAGAIMHWLHIYIMRRRKTYVAISCYAFLVFEFWDLHSLPLPIVLASSGVLLIVFLTYLVDYGLERESVHWGEVSYAT